MIGYHKKFVFVHIPKNGGTSVSRVLRHYALPPHKYLAHWALRRMGHFGQKDPFNIHMDHSTAQECRAILGPARYDDFFTFTVVRDPWRRLYSSYRYSRMVEGRTHYDEAMKYSFEDFVEFLADNQPLAPQLGFVVDETGQIMVDFVAKLERLDEDFAHVCAQIGINRSLPHKNKSTRSRPEAITPRAVERIGQLYADDIAAFGYAPDEALADL